MIKTTSQLTQFDSQKNELICQGEWSLATLNILKKEFKRITWPQRGAITVNGKAITKMDSAGAWLLSNKLSTLKKSDAHFQLTDFSEQHQTILALIEKVGAATQPLPKPKLPNWLANVGKYAMQQLSELRDFFTFTGGLAFEVVRLIRYPSRFRWASLINVIDTVGLRALPIVALLSFMIGVVIAYQMGTQLRTYGANFFIVDFLGLSVLREFGPLLTAIMVAGRTGSAFTAQLGTMKINQEIDALNTMGVTPAELLLLPKIFGLIIALPLLTIWSDIFGIMGGMMMAHNMLGITPHDFLQRFSHVIPLRTLLIGLGKAPVFAMLIASIGCFEGMRVYGSADSVGQQTTRSVVLSIFFIIVVDAIFSVLLSKMRL